MPQNTQRTHLPIMEQGRLNRQTIVAVFPSRRVLAKALEALQTQPSQGIQQAWVLARSASGRIVKLSDGLGADEGAWVGAVGGALMTPTGLTLLGALALPMTTAGLVLAGGALGGAFVGGWAGRMIAGTLDHSRHDAPSMEALAAHIPSGSAALVLHVDDSDALLPSLREALAPYRATLLAPGA